MVSLWWRRHLKTIFMRVIRCLFSKIMRSLRRRTKLLVVSSSDDFQIIVSVWVLMDSTLLKQGGGFSFGHGCNYGFPRREQEFSGTIFFLKIHELEHIFVDVKK